MRTVLCLGACAIALGFWRCEPMPVAVERTASMTIQVTDLSPYMQTLFGSARVRGAEVRLRSVNYGTEYRKETDTTGRAVFTDLVSDLYSVTVVRVLTAAEVEQVTGAQITRKLSGGLVSLEIRADRTDASAQVSVDIHPVSEIVISELYTCGAPGAGLYWHDKYVELCNIGEDVVYLDGLVLSEVYKGFLTDPDIRSKEVWKFPGTGKDYPLKPGEFCVVATDAIDHRVNAPESIDLRNARLEFYLWTGPDIDNPAVPDMILIYQPNGFDWLMGGETDAFVLARVANTDSLKFVDDFMLIPKTAVIDGVEYLKDPTRLDLKKLDPAIDAGAAGGIQFYTGYSNERKLAAGAAWALEDNNNSTLDFVKINHPTPGYHYTGPAGGR